MVKRRSKKPETINYRTLKPEKDGYSAKDIRTYKDWNVTAANIKELDIKE
jgi:DNA-directed RNA polymerase beta' subunit